MKANRKYKENEEAVSAVIGVILMVAITVAIAATVYVYVSGMIGGGQQQTPTISFTMDNTNDRIIVSSADSSAKWDDITITTNPLVNVTYNGGTVNVTIAANRSTNDITAGDYLTIEGTDLGNVDITLRYDPTNTLMGTWKVYV